MVNEDIIVTIGVVLKDLKKSMNNVTNTIKNKLKAMTKQFQGWALSIMFFGMAMKRVFDTAWKTGSKYFQDASHSIEGTVTGFDLLNGAVAYLGFTIGQALEPVAAWLAPIIIKLALWVSENKGIAATILIIVGVLGTALMLIGMLVLGFAGLITFVIILSGIFSGIAGIFGAITLAGLGFFALIVAAILLLVIAWKTNFGGIRDFFISTFSIIWNYLKSVWKNITNIFKEFITFFKSIFKGEWENAWEALKNIVKEIIAIILKTFISLGAILVNVIIFAINLIKDTFFSLLRFLNWLVMEIVTLFIWLGGKLVEALLTPIQIVINAINRVIRAINRFAGTQVFKPIDVNFGNVIDSATRRMNDAVRDFFAGTDDNISAWQQAATLGYIDPDMVKDALGNVDMLLGTGDEARTYTTTVTVGDIVVTQQPGESQEDLAQRIQDIINSQTTGG